MSLYPDMDSAPVPGGQPPSYNEAVGGVYAKTPMGFYPPTAPVDPSDPAPATTPIVTTVVPLGPGSTRTICPECKSHISTTTKSEPGVVAYIAGFLLAVFGCWLGCCLIPCCMDDCMDIKHSCPECKAHLGKFKRF